VSLTPRERMREHYEKVWRADDPWEFDSSPFEREKYSRQVAFIKDRRYSRALEIGCGGGTFTRELATLADHVIALDVAPSAIARARTALRGVSHVDLRVTDAMDYDPHGDGPWDLVVISETLYSLGWLYPFFDVGWFAFRLFSATSPQGRVLIANTLGRQEDYLQLPWLIRTYRDLFVNIGFRVSREEVFQAEKHGIPFESLITLFEKPGSASERAR